MLTQLKICYNFFSELSLKPEICNGGYSVSSCELLFFCIILEISLEFFQIQHVSYYHHIAQIPSLLLLKITFLPLLPLVTMCARALLKHMHVPHHIAQQGKVWRIKGGNTMIAAHLGHMSLDRRHATHICVSCRLVFTLFSSGVPHLSFRFTRGLRCMRICTVRVASGIGIVGRIP